MVELPDFKRGDTFSLGCVKKDSDGTPENLSAVTITSQVRDGGDTLVGTATVSKANQTTSPGVFSVTIQPETTKNWELTKHLIDIEFSINGAAVSSDTMRFKVVKDITHA